MYAKPPEPTAPGDLLRGATAVWTAGCFGPWAFPCAIAPAVWKTPGGTREAPVLKAISAVSAFPQSSAPSAKCWAFRPQRVCYGCLRRTTRRWCMCIPFQVGKSHLAQHFLFCSLSRYPLQKPAKMHLVRIGAAEELQISLGVVSKYSSSVSFHPCENPSSSPNNSPRTKPVSAACPARAPCREVAVQTVRVGSWPPSLAHSRYAKEVIK